MKCMANDSTPIKAVIFDFDGTIADSFGIFVQVVAVLLKRQPLSEAEIADLRKHAMPVVIKKLGVRKWQLPRLVIKGRREVDRRMSGVAPFSGIPEVLERLAEQGYQLSIVSSHAPEGIMAFLDAYELRQFFTDIYGSVGLLSKPKTLKKLQKQHGFAAKECVFVGDEVRDVEAAHRAGMHCIAVGWGFNTEETLKGHHPSLLVHTPIELLQKLSTIR